MQNKKIKAVGKIAYRVLLPFSAMRTSIFLMRKQISNHKENIEKLKDLKGEAVDSLKVKTPQKKYDSFKEMIGTDSKEEVASVKTGLIRQKKINLSFGYIFIFFEVLMCLLAFVKSDYKTLFFFTFSVFITVGLTFVVCLGKEFRIWQLQVERLTEKEKGGFQHFVNENSDWILKTISF